MSTAILGFVVGFAAGMLLTVWAICWLEADADAKSGRKPHE